MDLSRGSIDLSRSGPYVNENSNGEEIHEEHVASSMTSSSYFPNGNLMTHKPYYPSPDIPINRGSDGQLEHSENDCLDLSRTGPYCSSYMHLSGGMSIDLSLQQNGGTTSNNRIDLGNNGVLYQLPRIKLEPGLGIGTAILFALDEWRC